MQEVVTALNRPNLSTQESLKRTRKPGENSTALCLPLSAPKQSGIHLGDSEYTPKPPVPAPATRSYKEEQLHQQMTKEAVALTPHT